MCPKDTDAPTVKLKRKVLTPDADGDGLTDTATLYALSIILRMARA